MSLDKETIKDTRNIIDNIVNDLKNNFNELENLLFSKNKHRYFSEFYKHGEEFINFLTDKQIDELLE